MKLHKYLPLAILALFLLSQARALESVQAKFIKTGWDDPFPGELAKNLQIIEDSLPHQGIAVELDNFRDEKGKLWLPSYTMFTRRLWKKEYLQPQVDILKKIPFRKLKYNFIKAGFLAADKDFDLHDDELWKGIYNNFGIIAWMTREAGFRGICLDIEDYWRQHNWKYRPEKGRTFEQEWDKARQRGREFIRTLAAGNPNMDILVFFWLDLEAAIYEGTPELLATRLKRSHTGLLPAFVNGIYDELPPGITIHDGMEDFCYKINNGIDSYNNFRSLRANGYKRVIDPANHRKLRAQTLFAPAMYIDSYINESGIYRLHQPGMTQLELFRYNALLAAEFSDCYVWTFSEGRKWYPHYYKKWEAKSLTRNPKAKGIYWKTAFPGMADAITFAQSPLPTARKMVDSNKSLNLNAIVNGGFNKNIPQNAKTCRDPEDILSLNGVTGWKYWLPEKATGKFIWSADEGIGRSAAVKGIGLDSGCLLQTHKIKRGKSYMIRASAKGNTNPLLTIQWQNAEGRWCCHFLIQRMEFLEDLGNGWKRATQFIRFPPAEARAISVQLSPNGTKDKNSICIFDNVEFFEL